MDDHEIEQGIVELVEDDQQPHRKATMNRHPLRRRAMVLGLAVSVIGAGLAAACAPSAHAESTLERIKAGVDVEILRHILADMGVPEIDGYATVAMNVELQLREMPDPGLERADPFEQPVEAGKIRYGVISFAVRQDDQDLLDEVNRRLSAFRGTPEYLAILEKYGLTKADLPPEGMTTAQICAG